MTNGMGTKKSLLAVASLTSALIIFFPPAWIAAMILGVVALVEIKQSGGTLRGRGMAVAGIVVSLLWSVVLVIFLAVSLGGGASRNTTDLFPPAQDEALDQYDDEEPATATPAATPAAPEQAAPSTDQTTPATQ